MRSTIFLLILLCFTPKLFGQDTVAPESHDEQVVQELIEKFSDLQPPDLSYADLAADSDLIVIAKALSKTEIERNDEIGGEFGKESTKMLVNRLKILSVLKGKSADEVNVITLEWNSNVLVLTNYDFAELRTQLLIPVVAPVVIDGGIVDYGKVIGGEKTYTIEPEDLLYLRHLDGDNYVAVTGQRYSGLSVRRLK